MKLIKRKLQIYALLMLFWLILNGTVNVRLLVYGTLISAAIIMMTEKVIFDYDDAFHQLPSAWRFLWFAGVVLIAIIQSSVAHVFRIFRNENAYVVFKVRLKTENVIINTLIANAITLTPGTIAINIEGNTLEVIGFSQGEQDVVKMIRDIKNYEKPFFYRR